MADKRGDPQRLCAVGEPLRETLARKCEDRKLTFATVVYAGAVLSPEVRTGQGAVVCDGSVLTTNIRTGRRLHVNMGRNMGRTVSHDVVIGDFASLNPRAHKRIRTQPSHHQVSVR